MVKNTFLNSRLKAADRFLEGEISGQARHLSDVSRRVLHPMVTQSSFDIFDDCCIKLTKILTLCYEREKFTVYNTDTNFIIGADSKIRTNLPTIKCKINGLNTEFESDYCRTIAKTYASGRVVIESYIYYSQKRFRDEFTPDEIRLSLLKDKLDNRYLYLLRVFESWDRGIDWHVGRQHASPPRVNRIHSESSMPPGPEKVLFQGGWLPEMKMPKVDILGSEITDNVTQATKNFNDLAQELKDRIPKVDATCDNLNSLIDGVSARLPLIDEKSNRLDDIISDVKGKLENVNTSRMEGDLKNFLDKTQDGLNIREFGNDFLAAASIVAFVSASAYYLYSRSTESLMILGTAIVAMVVFASNKIQSALLSLSKYFNNTSDVKAQMFSIDDFCMAATTFLLGCALKDVSAFKFSDTLIRHLSGFSRVKDNFKGICSFFLSTLQMILSAVGLAELVPWNFRNMMISQQDMRRFADRVDSVFDSLRKGEFMACEDNYIYLKTLREECFEFLKNIPSTPETSGLRIHFMELKQMLSSAVKKMEETNFSLSGVRVEPACIGFIGGPGVGKSQAMEHLCTAILARTLPEELRSIAETQPHVFIYAKNPATGFDDGYHQNTVICKMNEFAQAVDAAGDQDNEYMCFLRYVDHSTCILNMAHLENKGNMLFKAKFVIFTSNLGTIATSSIKDREALYRRMHQTWLTYPPDEYCTDETIIGSLWSRRLDYNKLPIGVNDTTSLHPRCLRFIAYDWNKGLPYGAPKTFDEITEMAIELQAFKVKCFEQNKLDLADTYNQHAAIRDQDLQPQMAKFWESETVDAYDIRLDSIPNLVLAQKFIDELNEPEVEDGITKPFSQHVCLQKTMIELMHAQFQRCPLGASYTPVMALAVMLNMYGFEVFDVIYEVKRDRIKKMTYNFFVNFDPVHMLNFKMISKKENPPLVSTMQRIYDSVLAKIKGPLCDSFMAVFAYIDKNPWVLPTTVFVYKASVSIMEYFNKTEAPLEPILLESTYQGRQERSKAGAKSIRNRVKPQIGQGADNSGLQRVNKVINKNMYKFVLTKEGNKRQDFGFVTAVLGRTFLVNNHFVMALMIMVEDNTIDPLTNKKKNGITEESVVVLEKCGSAGTDQSRLFVTVGQILDGYFSTPVSVNRDFCLVAMPQNFPNKADIREMFPTQKKIDSVTALKYRLVNMDGLKSREYVGAAKKAENIFVGEETLECITLSFHYDALTDPGDCGSLFTVINAADQGPKIYGIHSAAGKSPTRAYAGAVTIDLIEEILNDPEFPLDAKVVQKDVGKLDVQMNKVIGTGQYTMEYMTAKPCPSFQKSSITRSELYEAWGPALYMPAKLRPFVRNGVEINPWHIAVSKYGLNYSYLRDDTFSLIRDNLADYLFSKSRIRRTKEILTFQEAVLGCVGDPDFKSISRNTSPGYPLNLIKVKGCKGKQAWLGNGQDYDLTNEMLATIQFEAREMIRLAETNERTEILFMDNLKDETRPIEKVLSGKTRMFSACPFTYLIVFRMYFGAFCSWFAKNRIDNSSAIGVNPFSTEWHYLYTKLARFETSNGNCGAGDFSGYDGSCLPLIYWKILDIINQWYDDEFAQIRRILWLELVYSRHIQGEIVYSWNSSLPSGHPLTAIVNTLYHQMAMRYSWFRSVENKIIDLWQFDDSVYMISLGDDGAFSVRDDCKDIFNEQTICAYMSEIGMTYTSEKKEKSVIKTRKITEIEFLKRAFRFEPMVGRFVSPLSMETITQMPYHTKKGADSDETTESKLQDALDEAAQHGKEEFERVRRIFLRGCDERDFPRPSRTSYSECLLRITQKEDTYY